MAQKRSKRGTVQPNWRPNFRNEQRLPDIKVVRTGFLLNFISAAILATAVFVFGYREYQASILASSIDELQTEMTKVTKAHKTAQENYNKFKAAEARFEEINSFLTTIIAPGDFLDAVAVNLPAEGVILEFSYGTSASKNISTITVSLSGSMDPGTTRDAPSMITQFERALIEDPRIAEVLNQKSLSFRPDLRFPGSFTFDLTIEMGAKKK